MIVVGRYYDVWVCPECRDQISPDADGNPDVCGCGYAGMPVTISLFQTDVAIRLRLKMAARA